MTYDGADLKVYINGKGVITLAHEFTTKEVNRLTIGAFNGQIDDFKVYDVALDEFEIQYLYNFYEYNICDYDWGEWDENEGNEDGNEDGDGDGDEDGDSSSISEVTGTSIEMYPNPANGVVYIKGVDAGLAYSIVDLTGKSVLNGQLNENNSIDVSSLRDGYYVVRLANGVIEKLIIKN